MRLGALETGGTKMVCAIGDENGNIYDKITIPTKTPKDTVPKMLDYFQSNGIDALGIGSFGPINPIKGTSDYGYITSTPKIEWQNYNIVGNFEEKLGCPVGFDTDVNAAALAEVTFGTAKGLDSCIYITVGTGVGVGIYTNGGLLHGMLHPEAGHILVRHHPNDSYKGKCPFHADCLEGLASGPAIEERWGAKAAELINHSEVWELEAYYLAQACVNYTLVLAPKRIVFGGGVMKQKQLYPLIRKEYNKMLSDYIKTEELKDLEHYIIPSSLNGNQGIMGCLKLAHLAI